MPNHQLSIPVISQLSKITACGNVHKKAPKNGAFLCNDT